MAAPLKKSTRTGFITRFRANLVLGLFVLTVALSAVYAIFEFYHPTAIESETYVPIRGADDAEIVIKID